MTNQLQDPLYGRTEEPNRSGSSGPWGESDPGVEFRAAGIAEAIGRTPVALLERLFPKPGPTMWAKIEALNPGGSGKDRAARGMIESAVRAGDLVPGRSTVVESSSGNLAIGLAQVCRLFDLRLVCVVDARTTEQNLRVLAAYGAQCEIVQQPDFVTGEYLPARLRRVAELVEALPDAFWPNQYANLASAKAQQQMMAELWQQLDRRVDYLFVPTGTCGTLRGCSDHLRSVGADTRIVAVDAAGSVIFGDRSGPRRIPGHGASVRPALYTDSLADSVVHRSDLDCVVGCRRLARSEAILAGGSSGAVISAAIQLRESLPVDARCGLILPDRGERYLDTVYSDAWVRQEFGEVSELWSEAVAC